MKYVKTFESWEEDYLEKSKVIRKKTPEEISSNPYSASYTSSQKVPKNWLEVAVNFLKRTCGVKEELNSRKIEKVIEEAIKLQDIDKAVDLLQRLMFYFNELKGNDATRSENYRVYREKLKKFYSAYRISEEDGWYFLTHGPFNNVEKRKAAGFKWVSGDK